MARQVASAVFAWAVAACGGGDGGTTPPPAGGSIGVTLSSTGLSVQQGTSGSVTVTVSRSGSFSGSIELTAESAPPGVTASFSPASVASGLASSALTVTAATTAAAGSATITVRARGQGVSDQTSTLTVTITAAPVPAFTFSVAPATLSVAQGLTGSVAATVARSGGFTSAIAIAIDGLPNGITVGANPTSIASGITTATITFTVGGTVPAQSYTIGMRATAGGVSDQTANVTITVTQAGTYTLASSPAALTIQQGGNATSTININRTGGFAAPVAFTSSGAPSGMTVTVSPTPTTNNSTLATVTVGASVAAGSYPITVRGTATGVPDQTTTLTVQVTASGGGGGNVTYQFCGNASAIPVWFAFQDGNGAWTRVNAGSSNTFAFSITQSRGAVAYVLQSANGSFNTIVNYLTQAELTSAGTSACVQGAAPGTKVVNGSVSGLAVADQASIALGSSNVTVSNAPLAFQLTNVGDGAHDLIAGRTSLTTSGGTFISALSKLIIRRNQDPANNSTLPLLDFGGGEAFDPVTRTVTVSGQNSELSFVAGTYVTANGTTVGIGSSATGPTTTRTFWGVPSSRQVAGDLHSLMVTATPNVSGAPTELRSATSYFAAAADQVISLGPSHTAVTVATVAGTPYARLRGSFTPQTSYNRAFSALFTQGGAVTRSVTVSLSAGYLSSGVVDLTIPDLTAAAGFNTSWMLSTGVSTSWTVSSLGWMNPNGILSTPIVDGALLQAAARMGTITP
jgi:trimeric autotransporter adhesin